MLLACGPAYFDEDEVRAGVSVDWGSQRDRGGLEALVASCEASVAMSFTGGASVKFVPDPNAHCGIPAEKPVAGCWIPRFDLIVLAPAPTLAQTALCHELFHRELYARDGDPDYDHLLPQWKILHASGI